jgi:hypothetical protein
MRLTERYGFDGGKQDAPFGTIVVELISKSYHEDDGIVGHTVHGGPYELNIWCDRAYKITTASDFVLKPLDGSHENVAVPEAQKPFTGKYPAPWHYCFAEPVHLKRTDYRLSGRIVVEIKTGGNREEQNVNVVLKATHTRAWSNDILSGLMSE